MLDLLFHHMKVLCIFYYVLLLASLIGTLDVTCDICPCKFATTMQLPCHRILAVCEKRAFHCFQKLVCVENGQTLFSAHYYVCM